MGRKRKILVHPRVTELLTEVAGEYLLTADDLLEKVKMEPAVTARHHAMHELRKRNWSYPRIARIFGMHHTSVIHGVRKHAEARTE